MPHDGLHFHTALLKRIASPSLYALSIRVTVGMLAALLTKSWRNGQIYMLPNAVNLLIYTEIKYKALNCVDCTLTRVALQSRLYI